MWFTVDAVDSAADRVQRGKLVFAESNKSQPGFTAIVSVFADNQCWQSVKRKPILFCSFSDVVLCYKFES
jgi:hypothetical protein